MNPFQVWIRPLGQFCRVRVDSIKNAQWLLEHLSREFVFKTSEPIVESSDSACCSFLVPYNPPLSPTKFDEMLKSIPSVRVMREPEPRFE